MYAPAARRIADYVSLKSAVHVAPRLAVTASMIGRAALFWRARQGRFRAESTRCWQGRLASILECPSAGAVLGSTDRQPGRGQRSAVGGEEGFYVGGDRFDWSRPHDVVVAWQQDVAAGGQTAGHPLGVFGAEDAVT
jgi:hypothetical protein